MQARTHVQLALACQQSMLKVSRTGCGSPCNTCTATPGIWEMNVLIMPPHLGHSIWHQVTTNLHVGLVIILVPLLALVLATTLEMSWKNCVTLEQK